jgi:hypothetical protein
MAVGAIEVRMCSACRREFESTPAIEDLWEQAEQLAGTERRVVALLSSGGTDDLEDLQNDHIALVKGMSAHRRARTFP